MFLLKFADDIVLLAECASELQKSADRTAYFFRERYLAINHKKCKTMVVKGHSRTPVVLDIQMDGVRVDQVTEFCYLGVFLNECFDLNKAAKKQENKMVSAYYSLCSKIKSLPSAAPFSVAEQMFEADVASTAGFGVEIFGPNKAIDKYCVNFLRFFFT